MTFLAMMAIYAVLFIAAELLRPKPEIENARPSGLSDFNFPTATEGRPVPLIWGTVVTASPNVIWYGDLRTERIREKVKVSMFSSKKVTVGYRYFVGFQLGLCRGPMDGAHDGLIKILIDDDLLWENGSPEAIADGSFTVDQPDFFGQDKGGISGTFTMFPGTTSQNRSSYLEGVTTFSPDILPAYRGTAYLVAEQVYIGQGAQLAPIKLVLRRIPDGLSLGADAYINNADANPMNVLYEILTNADWGLGNSSGDVDIATLSSIGATLASEGNGFSALLDKETKIPDLIKEIERQTSGVMYRDINTAQYTFKLIREADIPSPLSSLPTVDETNCKTLELSRGSWSETTNIVRVKYADPDKNYAESYAGAQDIANLLIQGAQVSTTENFMGVKNKTLANYLAWRDLRNLARPVAKAKMVVNRELYSVVPGDLIAVNWDLYGLSDFLMRITKVNYGELLSNKITIEAIEDVFTEQAASFADPIDSSWVAPTQTVTAENAEDQLIFETPRLMQLQDPDYPTVTPRITSLARLTGGYGDEYELLTHQAATKAGAVVGTFTQSDHPVPNFVLAGTLRDAMPGTNESIPPQGTGDYNVDPFSGETLADLIDAAALSETEINNLLSLVYITPANVSSPDSDRDYGEFVLYSQATESIGGSPQVTGIHLADCYRGALDSRPQSWPAGSLVWFVSFGGAGISSEFFTEKFYVAAKILPSTQDSGALSEGSATITNVLQIAEGFRYNLPLGPLEFAIQGSTYPASDARSVTLTPRTYSWLRRNWRTNGALKSVKGYNEDATLFDPGAADAGDLLGYILRVYDISSPNIGSPNLILEDETALDDSGNDSLLVYTNDLWAMVLNPESAQLRAEIWAKHGSSPEILSREPLVHDFALTNTHGTFTYTADKYLGRIPYGTVVSPGVLCLAAGSPGSPQSIPHISIVFADGARLNEGTGTGEQGKLYILTDDGSPAQLVADASAASPFTTESWNNLENGSPSNWAGHTLNILHYHYSGRPIFFQIHDSTTLDVYAWGVLEPFTSTVPLPGV